MSRLCAPRGGVGRNNCIRSKFIHSLNQQPAKLPFLNIALGQSITVKRPGQGNGLDVKAGRIRFLLLQGPTRLLDRSAVCMQDFMPTLCKLSAQLHLEGVAGMVVDEDTHFSIFHSIFITTFCVSEKKIPLHGTATLVVAHVINAFQYKIPLAQPLNNLMGQCLPSVQFHKRAFGIHV